MVSPTSPNKLLAIPVTGTEPGIWGDDVVNNTFLPIDKMLGGILNLPLSNTNILLTGAQAQNVVLQLTGTLLTAVQITTPAQGFLFVENLTSGAFNVTISNGVGTPVTVPQGSSSLLILDPVNGPYLTAGAVASLSAAGVIQLASNAEAAAFANAVKAITPASLGSAMTSQIRYLVKQSVTASSASLSVDMSLGWAVSLTLSNTVSSFTVSNWPATGTLGRLILEISSTGAFNITSWPGTTIWAGGAVPTITSGNGKKDTILLTSSDGGTNFRGYVISQNMS